jgi:hypothetical protein
MAYPTRKATALPEVPVFAPIALWSTTWVQSCLQVQQLQWNALTAWQQSLATFGKDFWEQWACRYTGGVPIDG